MNKIVRRVLIGVGAAAVLAYAGGTVYSYQHFLPGTTINGVSVAGMTAEEAEQALDYQGTSITVYERDASSGELVSEEMSLEKVNYHREFDTEALLKDGTHFGWLGSLFGATELTAQMTGFTYDEAGLEETIESLDCLKEENQTDPANAFLAVHDNEFYVAAEDDGCRLIYDKVEAAIRGAVETETTEVNLEEAGCYETAEVRGDDETLNKEAATRQNVLNKTVTLKLYDDQTAILDAATVESLLTIDGTDPVVNEKAVKAWAEALSESVGTVNHKRTFKDHAGDIISPDKVTYDYYLDVDGTVAALEEVLTLPGDQTAQAKWLRDYQDPEDKTKTITVSGLDGSDLLTDTYIEISIDDQKMWYFENGVEMLETDVVTGWKGYTDSPHGVFTYWHKESPATLMAGTKVVFWMAFYKQQYGIHDADWRSEFGGDIYLEDGSHGCINTPYDAVEWLFNNVEYGTYVVIYEVSELEAAAAATAT